VVGAGEPAVSLHWSQEPTHLSEPVGTRFWEFLTLADASDEAIITFARRFGPLRWPEAADEARVQPPDGESGAASSADTDKEGAPPLTEPLRIWRMYARGLAALYDLVDPALPPQARDSQIWTWSAAAAAIPLWLADPNPERQPEEGWLAGFVTANYALEDGPASKMAWGEQLVTASLVGAGIDPAFATDPAVALAYTLPASAIESGAKSQDVVWRVQGLLPILTVSLAVALRTQERPRCTRCGKPAAIVERAPRKGRAWYGDHTWCRALARAETIMAAEQKRAERSER
jgi:hypothetical protein